MRQTTGLGRGGRKDTGAMCCDSGHAEQESSQVFGEHNGPRLVDTILSAGVVSHTCSERSKMLPAELWTHSSFEGQELYWISCLVQTNWLASPR